MRIVICAVQAPTQPFDGFRLQLDRIGAGLARRHDITLLALVPADEPVPSLEWGELVPVPLNRQGLPAKVGAALSALLGRRPKSVGRITPPMAAALESLLTERTFDVAQVSGPQLGGLPGVAKSLGSLPAVLTALDAWDLNVVAEARTGSPLMRPYYFLEKRNVRRFMAREFAHYRRVVVVSNRDERALRELNPDLKVETVPNGVDVDAFRPNPAVTPEPGLVVFTGAMHWAPNIEAARFLATEILPRLRGLDPRARLAIVGRNPAPDVQRLGGIDGVEVTGEVPDIRTWLWRAEAFACPMVSGTGIKNKLLEALACATPCVATAHACEGIRVVPGEDLLVADSAAGLAEGLATLLDDAELRRRIGSRGRDAVVAGNSWDAAVRAYETIFEQELAGDRERSEDRATPE